MAVGNTEKVLDLKGLVCPEPQYQTAQALETAKPGDIIKIIVDNPESIQNISIMAKEGRHEIVSVSRDGTDVFTIILKVK